MGCACSSPLPPTEQRPPSPPKGRQLVLFAVRHGEAMHNIREKEAKQSAERTMVEAGSPKSSDAVKQASERARQESLQDSRLHDAELSEAGKEGARTAKAMLEQLCAQRTLPHPTLVLTSPLQRALQTAAIIFPDHPKVCVREELRERRTGLPCDEHGSMRHAAKRTSFSFMRFSTITAQEEAEEEASRTKLSIAATSNRSSTYSIPDEEKADSPFPNLMTLFGGHTEEKSDVRKRSERLFDVLETYGDEHRSVCLVTHKGWLREFERGPLGRPNATEFGNCELRAFQLTIGEGGITVTPISGPDLQESGEI